MKEILQTQDFDQLLEQSDREPVLIFKHSTQCSISDAVFEEFNEFLREAEPRIDCRLVLVIERRAVSNAIAARLGVRHESPQVIIVDKGQKKWTASHWAITADSLRKALGI